VTARLISPPKLDGDKVKRQKQLLDRWLYAAYFFPARIFAHRALCAAAILFLPAAEIVRFGFGARPFAFAHRALCARLIRLRADADIVCCLGLVELRPPPILPRTERAAST
jgi:hypothetical protein